MAIDPLYTAQNCRAAYQLNWSLSIFGKRSLPDPAPVTVELNQAVAGDEIRILETRFKPPNVAQFFLSSKPPVNPPAMVRSVKARWQYLLRPEVQIEFRRNYHMASVGSAKSAVLDHYVAGQTDKHRMADPNVQAMLKRIQFHDPKMDLSAVRRTSHGQFSYALQVVIESESGWHEIRPEVLEGYLAMIQSSCRKHNWLLSRIGLLSNHIHVLLGPQWDDSPESVALSLLNNLAWTQGMKRMFRFSYYVGTFGEYDRGAIWLTQRRESG